MYILTGKLSRLYQVELLDLQGKKLLGRSFRADGDQVTQEVDVRQLPAGLYFLRVGDGEAAVVRKVVLR